MGKPEGVLRSRDSFAEFGKHVRRDRKPAVAIEAFSEIEPDDLSRSSLLYLEGKRAARGADIEYPLILEGMAAKIFVITAS